MHCRPRMPRLDCAGIVIGRRCIYPTVRKRAAVLFRVVSIAVRVAMNSKHNALVVRGELQIGVNLRFALIQVPEMQVPVRQPSLPVRLQVDQTQIPAVLRIL